MVVLLRVSARECFSNNSYDQKMISFARAKLVKSSIKVIKTSLGNTSDCNKLSETLFPDEGDQARIYVPLNSDGSPYRKFVM